MGSEDDDEAAVEAHINRLITDRCRITDADFRDGLSMEVETRLIERMIDEGYAIGMDASWQNEFWPPPHED